MNLKHCGSNCRNSIWIHFNRVFCFFPSNALAIMGKSRKEIHFPRQSVTNHEWLFFKLPLCISVRTDSSRCTSPPRKNPKLLRAYLAHMFSQTVGSNDYFDYICDMRYLDASENEECSVTWSIHKADQSFVNAMWMLCMSRNWSMAEKATSADLFVAMAWDIFFELDNCFVVCILFKIVLFCLQYVQFVFGEFSSLAAIHLLVHPRRDRVLLSIQPLPGCQRCLLCMFDHVGNEGKRCRHMRTIISKKATF